MKDIAVGTLTAAQRARAVLMQNGINCSVRRLIGARGCVHAVEIDSRDYDRALMLLRRAGIAH